MSRVCLFAIPVNNGNGWLRIHSQDENMIVEAGMGSVYRTVTIPPSFQKGVLAAVAKFFPDAPEIPAPPSMDRTATPDGPYDLVTCDCSAG